MLPFQQMTIPEPITHATKKGLLSDDNIFTFDIETISLFEINGKWQPFDYSIPPKEYEKIRKAGCCYIWQFSVNEDVYYGRELEDFGEVLKRLSTKTHNRYIFVHNLGYEMEWLFDIILHNGWTITELCARNLRQPIQFKIEELNIYFRCSYMLTNLSLEKSAEKYTDIKKAVGELDYNIPYSPLSDLPENVMHYAEMDCKTLYKIILFFRNEYGHIKSIPLTQTGEVRKALRDEVGYYYIKEQQKKVPTFHIYDVLQSAFMGGISHGNILYLNKIITSGVWSFDFCSSYPFCLCCYDYPSTPFVRINERQAELMKDTHCIIYEVDFEDIESKYFNHYLPFSKIANPERPYVIDNGRVTKLHRGRMILTDIDLEMVKKSYRGTIKFIRAWASHKAPLDSKVVKFILTKYANKTTIKGIKGQEDFYQKEKQFCNSIFGMSCSNVLKTGVELNGDEWSAHNRNDDDYIKFATEKLDGMKRSYSTLFYPMAIGVYCTAYARRNLWANILKLDWSVAYYDTDSIKGTGDEVYSIVEEYNKHVDELLERSSKIHNIPMELYKPFDQKGICHPLGYFENETENGLLPKFCTLGAKKYLYMDSDGEKHLTMSGVRKSAVKYVDFDTFKNGFTFGYKECGKLTHYYNDNQDSFTYTDIDGNEYLCQQEHAIILQPTTFTIGQTQELLALILEHEGYISDF